MTLPKLRPFALPLLALLAISGAALAQPYAAAPTGPSLPHQRATELSQPVVEKPSLAKSGHGDDDTWFYFGKDDGDDDDHGDDDGDDDDDDDEGARGAQGNCALTPGTKAAGDCNTRSGQSATPPANGLFTPGTAPQVKSN